jgi:hypothetical protein
MPTGACHRAFAPVVGMTDYSDRASSSANSTLMGPSPSMTAGAEIGPVTPSHLD